MVMDFKKIIFTMLTICLLSGIANANHIENYKVPNQININRTLTVSGIYIDDLNDNSNQVCNLYIIDDNNIIIYKASSQRTDQLGTFYFQLKVEEPRIKRSQTYTAKSICVTSEATANFTVENRETIYWSLLWDFKALTDSENVIPVLLIGGGTITIFILLNSILFYARQRRF